jgi:CRISPR type III-A-associated RAMP protein Csm4
VDEMADFTYYQLEPRGGRGFHFGEEGLELEESAVIFASDSLFAALVATLAEQEGNERVKTWLQPFAEGEPPFRLSSLFPYVGGLALLPMPSIRMQFKEDAGKDSEEPPVPRKFGRKVKFISPVIFQRICAGEEMNAYVDEGENGRFLQNGTVWFSREEVEQLPSEWIDPEEDAKDVDKRRAFLRSPETLRTRNVWYQDRVPRVTLDRLTNASNIYLTGRVSFSEKCGLWFAAVYEDKTRQADVENLLHHLADRGIGGERTNGYGAFNVMSPPHLTFPKPVTGNGYAVLLSRFMPADKAETQRVIENEKAAYRLVRVGGWMNASLGSFRRRRVHMLAEGSLVPAGIGGKLVNVKPKGVNLSHDVYRSGLALTMPVFVKEEMDDAKNDL